jgi:GNAT superfamily N-acetyltransferase
MKHAVAPANVADLPSWLEIARQVEPLFGAMAMFDVTLRAKITQGKALCVRDAGGRVIGGLLLGGEQPDLWIRWLAVRRAARGRGIGSALVSEAMRRLDAKGSLSLITFGADNLEGAPARRLYARLGFLPGPMQPRGPEGGTRQLFRLVRM